MLVHFGPEMPVLTLTVTESSDQIATGLILSDLISGTTELWAHICSTQSAGHQDVIAA
jgi:hypothetical protein